MLLQNKDRHLRCRICDNSVHNKIYEVKEMYYGFRDVFTYFQCSACGCLQIEKYPADMSKYYPPNYYSFALEPSVRNFKESFKRLRDKGLVFHEGILEILLSKLFPGDRKLEFCKNLSFDKHMKILDVGCGSGGLLLRFAKLGFTKLCGVDPLIEKSIQYSDELKIIKGELSNINDTFDMIMFHHSFEHMPCQIDVLKQAFKLLSCNGVCLIRIPIVSSYVWEHYGVNWVELDAPRHYYLHSIESMNLLANRAGLEVFKVEFESKDLEIFGSELYSRGIPLVEGKDYFSRKQMAAFSRQAQELNKSERGGRAAFYLKKSL